MPEPASIWPPTVVWATTLWRDAFSGALEGQNLAFVLHYAADDPSALRGILWDLMKVPADLIVSSGPAISAMKATAHRPVLFAISGDPVELGIAESLSRPGKNFTGSTFMSLDVAQKRVQLLKELLPNLKTLAVLSQTNHPGEQSELNATRAAADGLGIRLAYVPFASAPELDGALERIHGAKANAMLVFPDGVTLVHRARIAEFAKMRRLPSILAGGNTAKPVGSPAMAPISGTPTSDLRPMPTVSCAARSQRLTRSAGDHL